MTIKSVLRIVSLMQALCIIVFSTTSCDSATNDDDNNGDSLGTYLELMIIPTQSFQTINGFGASDAWSVQFVGKNWPEQKRERIADLLFSTEVGSNGNPIGIGLNSWRFNLGAGSSEQGANSGIQDDWRRAESFLSSNGYDWNAQEGQRNFMLEAKARGVNHFTAFSNSPPVSLTSNGKAHSSGGNSVNLNEERFADYAEFLVNCLEQLDERHNLQFDYVSPFNEPQWDWTEGQEGTPWLNSEIASFCRILDDKISERGISTKIEISEAGKLNYLYENADRPGRANQLADFFSPESVNFLGNLQSMSQRIAGHSYYTTFSTDNLLQIRRKLWGEVERTDPGLEFWMTEYCLLENNSEINGNGRDLGMDPALYLARVIHSDLTVANASSWYWWLGISPYDYKDGLLYIDKNKMDGEIHDSKMLWALGHYSRFIREGYLRTGLRRSDNKSIEQSINGLLVSAYKSPDSTNLILVIVNQRSINVPVKLKIEGKDSFIGKIYLTNGKADHNLSFEGELREDDLYEIPAKSMVTITLK